MKIRIMLLFALSSLLLSCNDDDANPGIISENRVLLLKVDCTTNNFEGGKELSFDEPATTFTVQTEYEEPADFGWIKLFYEEQQALLFDGQIHWNGLGSINYPESFSPPSAFEVVLTEDYVTPSSGFEDVFNPNSEEYDYYAIWGAVQNLVKVRQYLESNPDATVKIFLYTPSVGIGNPEEWDWILILKN